MLPTVHDTHALPLAQMRNSHYEKKIFSPPYSVNSLPIVPGDWNEPAHTKSIVFTLMVVIHGYECKWLGTMWLQTCDYSPLIFCGGFGMIGPAVWWSLSFPAVWCWKWREEEEEGQGLGWAEEGGGLGKKNKLSLLQPILTVHSDWFHRCCSQMISK